jgi:hypothetical protein
MQLNHNHWCPLTIDDAKMPKCRVAKLMISVLILSCVIIECTFCCCCITIFSTLQQLLILDFQKVTCQKVLNNLWHFWKVVLESPLLFKQAVTIWDATFLFLAKHDLCHSFGVSSGVFHYVSRWRNSLGAVSFLATYLFSLTLAFFRVTKLHFIISV